MPATEGAIEAIKINKKGGFDYKVINNITPKGLCGSGLVDLLAELFVHGYMDRNGKFIQKKAEKIMTDTEGGQGLLIVEGRQSFWGNDIVNTIEEETMVFIIIDSTGSVSEYPGYHKSVFYWSNNNLAAVSVFKSQEIPIAAMEERRKNVSMLIYPGDPNDDIKDIWWWGVYLNFQREIFVNRWNTIIEACILNYDFSKDDSVRTLLENTALELINRVDKLSVELM